jgi:putative acetyltransferase
MNTALQIEHESPRRDDVQHMIAALDAYVAALYPPESNHLLDIEALCAPDVWFFVARIDGEAVGCGALRIDAEGYGELKRMFVRPELRGKRLGHAILERLEQHARAQNLRCIRLETGIAQVAALALYRSAGYLDIPPFGPYRDDPLSVFMEKPI